ncbi:hypothetical protein V0M98_35225 (plasmid) [Pseudomonas silesiensis]|uniref:hypothetical protein n=1 Tax=Pseudomonas silesiensis TaxID=1853130 RepID=UPI0030D373C2
MKHSDFHIGLDFYSSGGFPYRCTDVGQRTITAICLDRTSGQWYAGPPYPVEEKLFDELKINDCYLTETDAIKEAIAETDRGVMPAYPSEAMSRFMKARRTPDYSDYPNKPLLRLNKVSGGDILHPYGVTKRGEFWSVLCYLPFDEEYLELDEYSFLSLPLAMEDDYRARKVCRG